MDPKITVEQVAQWIYEHDKGVLNEIFKEESLLKFEDLDEEIIEYYTDQAKSLVLDVPFSLWPDWLKKKAAHTYHDPW